MRLHTFEGVPFWIRVRPCNGEGLVTRLQSVDMRCGVDMVDHH